jgi:hypothetical protein
MTSTTAVSPDTRAPGKGWHIGLWVAQVLLAGIRLRRDSWVSVRYSKELNSGKSSATLQRADRHEILGQKPAHFQLSL